MATDVSCSSPWVVSGWCWSSIALFFLDQTDSLNPEVETGLRTASIFTFHHQYRGGLGLHRAGAGTVRKGAWGCITKEGDPRETDVQVNGDEGGSCTG